MGRRKRDLEEEPGRGVYSSWEYREARKQLVVGKPCSQCGATEDICAHHTRAGDDTSLVPLCKKCHPTFQVALWYKSGEQPPAASVVNPTIYEGVEFAEALARLVTGQPCIRCGDIEDIKGHHRVQGDHESLIPLCRSCHGWVHAREPPYDPRGQEPPPGEQPPLCACGCGQPVRWKRVRGWGRYVHGHANAKMPAGSRLQEPPRCACGCGQPVKFRHGKGWEEYRRGHRGVVVARERAAAGDWTKKPPPGEQPPLCRCGCERPTQWKAYAGWQPYRRGHQPGTDFGPAPLCACGCGTPVNHYRGEWQKFRRGHAVRVQDHRAGAKLPPATAPTGEVPPLCRCGCGQIVNWKPYRGWAVCLRGHARGRFRKE